MNFEIPSGAKEIVRRLNASGYQAYFVGGCVRDCLMGRNPHDWDICTSALPEQVLACFRGHKVIETGLKHGTVSVKMDGSMYEVTTFRVDGDYSDGRHPDSVTFTTDLKEDLSRRDFTINAIAMTEDERICDPFDGTYDISYGIIRCVGDPKERFEEDGLRIMRALRFSSVLDFSIDKRTKYAMHECAHLIANVSAERIMTELKKLVVGVSPGAVLRQFPDVLSVFWPEVRACVDCDQRNKYHVFDVWEHMMYALDHADTDDLYVRLALLLHDIAKPQCMTIDENGYGHFYGHPPVCAVMADDMLRRIKFDNATREAVVQLIEYHDATVSPTEKSVRRWLNKLGEEQLGRLLSIKIADGLAHNPDNIGSRISDIYAVREILENVLLTQQCFSIKDLAVNGLDVMATGIQEGPQVGAVLNEILKRVIDGDLDNDRTILIGAIIHIKEEWSL